MTFSASDRHYSAYQGLNIDPKLFHQYFEYHNVWFCTSAVVSLYSQQLQNFKTCQNNLLLQTFSEVFSGVYSVILK